MQGVSLQSAALCWSQMGTPCLRRATQDKFSISLWHWFLHEQSTGNTEQRNIWLARITDHNINNFVSWTEKICTCSHWEWCNFLLSKRNFALMAGCIVIPQEQVLTIASEFGGLESMQFSPGLESCRWTVHHGSGFSKEVSNFGHLIFVFETLWKGTNYKRQVLRSPWKSGLIGICHAEHLKTVKCFGKSQGRELCFWTWLGKNVQP